jgi:hypothetical protein
VALCDLAQDGPAACAGGEQGAHGGAAAVAPESEGEGFEKDEGVTGELTEGSVQVEEGRERGLDGEGRSSGGGNGGRGGTGADSAEDWLERARDGAEEVESKARDVGARRIRAGRRGTAGGQATTRLGLLCSLEEEERDEYEKPPGHANG